MKTTRKVSRIFALILALCLTFALAVPAMAAQFNDAVTNAKNAVLQLQLWFVDPDRLDGDIYLGYGTGFLINEDTVITAEHLVNFKTNTSMASEYAAAMAEAFGTEYTAEEVMNHMEIRVSILRDVYVIADVRKVSAEMDYAILTLKEKVHNRTTLRLRSSSTLKQTENVYALGFPGDLDAITDQSFYDSDDVAITTGSVNKVARCSLSVITETAIGTFVGTYDNVDCVESGALLSGGNSGGPLVDANGDVVGINAASSDSRNLAISIDQLTATLDALGIEYESVPTMDLVTTTPTEAPTEVAPTEVPTVAPTEAPTAAPTEAPTQAPTVPVTPEPKNNTTIILIVAAVAVLAVIIVVVVVTSKGKKPSAPPTGTYTPPAPPQKPNGGFQTPPHTPAYTAPMDAGETTVLNQDAGETTVLTRNGGTLIRKRNGETVKINTDHFVIGRERKTANYCITDNTSISRSHVTLTIRGGVTYLTDMGAANGTFVNGVKVVPRQEIALKDGDKITLADEDFEFKA